jgi:hypothetical protein
MKRNALLAILAGLTLPGSASARNVPAGDIRAALQRAEQAGVASPAIEASETTLGEVRTAREGAEPTEAIAGLSEPGSQSLLAQHASDPVTMVTMRGEFELTLAHRPEGQPAPTGKYLTVAVQQGHVTYLQLGNEWHAVPGIKLTIPTGATAARRHRHNVRAAGWNPSECLNEHCYVLARWTMTGEEEVVGSQHNHVNEGLNVQEWEKGYFTDEEEWAEFPDAGYYWIESGQTAGEHFDCCHVHWFVAWRRKVTGYAQYVTPAAEEPGGMKHQFYLYTEGNGAWCAKVDVSLITCTSGLLTYSKQLSAGTEIASWSQPYLVTRDESNGWFTNWQAYAWNKQTVKIDGGQCWQQNPYDGANGDIRSWTC